MFLYLFAFKKYKSWVKQLFLKSGVPEVVGSERAGEWVCAWEVTRLWPLKNLGTAGNKVPSVPTAAGTSRGCAVALNLLFLGEDGFQVWFLPLNVRQGQVTWGSLVLQACLRLRFITEGVCGGTSKLPTSLGATGPLLVPPWPVLSCDRAGDMRGTTATAHLLWGFASPQVPRCIFFLQMLALDDFWSLMSPFLK